MVNLEYFEKIWIILDFFAIFSNFLEYFGKIIWQSKIGNIKTGHKNSVFVVKLTRFCCSTCDMCVFGFFCRYQGYVCPGIMVMIANSSHLELMADLWKRQLLTAPRGTRISQVGLSTGCVVRPVPVSHSVSLNDVLCLILARYADFLIKAGRRPDST